MLIGTMVPKGRVLSTINLLCTGIQRLLDVIWGWTLVHRTFIKFAMCKIQQNTIFDFFGDFEAHFVKGQLVFWWNLLHFHQKSWCPSRKNTKKMRKNMKFIIFFNFAHSKFHLVLAPQIWSPNSVRNLS